MTRHQAMPLRSCFLPIILLVSAESPRAQAALPDDPGLAVGAHETFRRLSASGKIVGGQLAVAREGEVQFAGSYGVDAIGSDHPVTAETLFLVGSCSKPFASACVLKLVEDPQVALGLDSGIDAWMPQYARARLPDGARASRPPTVAELLSHRAGIYSQKVHLTPLQADLLYNRFHQSLEEATAAIAGEPLISQPGSRYAYSGAGYCVLGRVAELAAGGTFEEILQERVCRPLDLGRTTYFPAGRFARIASGFAAKRSPHALGRRHKFPLVGGSLYSCATDMARFGQAVGGAIATADGAPFLGTSSFKALARKWNPSGYSLGWSVKTHGGRPGRLSHGGALFGYRASLVVDIPKGISVAAVWTLPEATHDDVPGRRITESLDRVLGTEE